jgi:hypothetical protein
VASVLRLPHTSHLQVYATYVPGWDWYAHCEDDMYVYPYRLLEVAARHDPSSRLMLAQVNLVKVEQDGVERDQIRFTDGGGGSLLSAAGFAHWGRKNISKCIALFREQHPLHSLRHSGGLKSRPRSDQDMWTGHADVIFSECRRHLGIQAIPTCGFCHESPSIMGIPATELGCARPPRQLGCLPLTFHSIKSAEEMVEIHNASLRQTGPACGAEFWDSLVVVDS